MIRTLIPAVALALGLAAPGVALAADPAPQASDNATDAGAAAHGGQASRNADKEEMGDPTRVICRKVEQIGSRVNAKRICATAAQWAQMRQEDRDGLEKIQTQRYYGNGS